MRKIIGTLALALVASGASLVEAQCAWVLWQNSAERDPMTGKISWLPSGWSPEEGYQTFEACAKQKNSLEMPASLWREGAEGKLHGNLFRCLPDTIDPRGPKR